MDDNDRRSNDTVELNDQEIFDIYTIPIIKFGDYRCVICDSRAGPFFVDLNDKFKIDMLCHTCLTEISDCLLKWDEFNRDSNE